MIVVDASALIEWLLRGPRAVEVERRVFLGGAEAHAPHLVDIEVTHVLRRLQRLGNMSAERGREALQDLADAPLRRVPHQPLLPRIWALRANFTAYDAAYVALAEALEGALVTLDAKLAKAAQSLVTVDLHEWRHGRVRPAGSRKDGFLAPSLSFRNSGFVLCLTCLCSERNSSSSPPPCRSSVNSLKPMILNINVPKSVAKVRQRRPKSAKDGRWRVVAAP